MKRRKRLKEKYLLITICMIALNVMGVSYAYWNDTLVTNVKITTGSLDLGTIPNGNSNIVLAQGSKGELYYQVYNRSDVPVEYKGYNVSQPAEGILISYDTGKVGIAVPSDQKPGKYNFKIDLNYSQKSK